MSEETANGTEPEGTEPEATVDETEPEERLNRIKAAAFFAADHVAPVEGKFYINGGFFNILRLPGYPAIVPTLGIGASLIVPWHAYQQDHHFAVTLHDEDRRELPLKIEGNFRVGADIHLRHGDPSVINIGGTVTNVVFERPGHYHLRLRVDDEELSRWDLQVIQVPTGFSGAAMPGLPQP
jgi:hypothetical protein